MPKFFPRSWFDKRYGEISPREIRAHIRDSARPNAAPGTRIHENYRGFISLHCDGSRSFAARRVCHTPFRQSKVSRPACGIQVFGFAWNPANSRPFTTSGFFANCSQTKLLRAFSAMTIVIPASMPSMSGLFQLFDGLKAST